MAGVMPFWSSIVAGVISGGVDAVDDGDVEGGSGGRGGTLPLS